MNLFTSIEETDKWWSEFLDWCQRFSIEPNLGPNKTAAIVVSGKEFKDWCASKGIPLTSEYKYLGTLIKIKNKKLVNSQNNATLVKVRMYKVISGSSYAAYKMANGKFRWPYVRAYLQAVQRGCLYGCEDTINSGATKKAMRQLDQAINKVVKRYFN